MEDTEEMFVTKRNGKKEIISFNKISKRLKNIGKELGGRDHSTVIHACNLVEKRAQNDLSFKKIIEKNIADLKKVGI